MLLFLVNTSAKLSCKNRNETTQYVQSGAHSTINWTTCVAQQRRECTHCHLAPKPPKCNSHKCHGDCIRHWHGLRTVQDSGGLRYAVQDWGGEWAASENQDGSHPSTVSSPLWRDWYTLFFPQGLLKLLIWGFENHVFLLGALGVCFADGCLGSIFGIFFL